MKSFAIRATLAFGVSILFPLFMQNDGWKFFNIALPLLMLFAVVSSAFVGSETPEDNVGLVGKIVLSFFGTGLFAAIWPFHGKLIFAVGFLLLTFLALIMHFFERSKKMRR